MNKKIFLILFLIISFPLVSSIGISYSKVAVESSGGESCFPYRVFNQENQEVLVNFKITGEIKDLLSKQIDDIPVPKETTPNNGVETELCFNIPKNCELGRTYSGSVIIIKSANSISAGSATSVGAAAPVQITCIEKPIEEKTQKSGIYKTTYLLTIFILFLAILFMISRKMINDTINKNSKNKN